MLRRVPALAVLLLGALAGSACRARSDEGRASPAEASSAHGLAAKAEIECRRILKRSWTAIQPALRRLRVAPERIENDYLGQLGAPFVESCSGLSAPHRGCLARAKNPPLALETCGINRDRRPAERVLLPSLLAHVTLLEPPALAAEQAERMLSSLIGAWVNVGADGRTNASWSFGKDGRLQIRERKGEALTEETFSVQFPARHRMALFRGAEQRQDIVLFRSQAALYVSRGLSYDVVPLDDRAELTLRNDASWIFWDGAACSAVTESGALIPATCGYEVRPDGRELFAVRYSVPPAREVTVSYPIVDGHLLHERLASYGRFVRRDGLR